MLEPLEQRLYLSGTITGQVFADGDEDGVRDVVEGALAGWEVFIDDNENGQLDMGETSTLTDSAGAFTFTGIDAGTHEVAVTAEDDWYATLPSLGSQSVLVVDNETTEDVDFGFRYERIIDDGDADFAIAGSGWSAQTWGAYQNDHTRNTRADSGGADKATWTFSGLADGHYEVAATWEPTNAYAVDAPFTIFDGATNEGTVRPNQTASPDDFSVSGADWERLGIVHVENGEIIIELDDTATSGTWVAADAVRVISTSPPIVSLILDEDDLGHTKTGTWTNNVTSGAYEGDQAVAQVGGGLDTYSWTFEGVDSGYYEVFASWNAYSHRPVDAPFTVYDDTTSVGLVRMNQRLAPDDELASGQWWESFGVFEIESGTLTVTLTDEATSGSWIAADAIRIAPVSVLPAPTILDEGDLGHTRTGVWNAATDAAAYEDDFISNSVGQGGADTHRWTFENLPVGTYEVQSTWPTYSHYSVDTPMTVLDGETVEALVRVNNQVAPSGETVDGQTWETLGTFDFESGIIAVEVSDDVTSGSYVIADAVRVKAVEVIPPSPAVMDEGDFGHEQTGTWQAFSKSASIDGDFVASQVGQGDDRLVFTFQGVLSGEYEVLVTWPSWSTYSVDAPFTVSNDTEDLGTVRVNQRKEPDDVLDSGRWWESLGVFTIDSGKLVVELTDGATHGDWVVVDAVWIRPVDPVSAPQILDEGDLGHERVGEWIAAWSSSGWDNDIATNAKGARSDTWTWTFDGLLGSFDFYATWSNWVTYVTDAPFTVLDDAQALGTADFNQQAAPNDLYADGAWWEQIGTFDIGSGIARVQLSDDASGGGTYVVADAVRVTPGSATLEENSDFHSSWELDFDVPANAQALTFTFSGLSFDATDTDGVNDAFELALIGADGKSLVGTIGAGRDAFFNLTEGEDAALGAGAEYDDQTGAVTIDVRNLTPGSSAKLIARLVNNDDDTDTEVSINTGIYALRVSPVEAAATATAAGDDPPRDPIDFAPLSDETQTFTVGYGVTSFDEQSNVLRTALTLTLTHAGNVSLRDTLLVGVRNISDPSVRLFEPHGVTPDGVPFYDVSQPAFASDSVLTNGENIAGIELAFINPDRIQFDYELVVITGGNTAPVITSEPIAFARPGNTYGYDVSAADPDGDTLTYSLLAGPSGMSIDDETGEVTWSVSTGDVGDHTVEVRVTDGHGGAAYQSYTLGVTSVMPNLPPQFVTTPVVDAYIGQVYTYNAVAVDPDGAAPSYDVTQGPGIIPYDPAFEIDDETGVVTWEIDPTWVGQTVEVVIQAYDGAAGIGEQRYRIHVHPDPENHAPVITSVPPPVAEWMEEFAYQVQATDPDGDVLNYTLVSYPGTAEIDENGLLTWTFSSIFPTFTIEVDDGRGGVAVQTFGLLSRGQGATITGTVWDDEDDDGVFDSGESGIPGVIVYFDSNSNGRFDPDEPTQVTAFDDSQTTEVDETGTYSFTGLLPGAYVIRQIVPTGYVQSWPVDGTPATTIMRITEDDFDVNTGISIAFHEYAADSVITDAYNSVLYDYDVEFGGFFEGQELADDEEEAPPGAELSGVVLGLPDTPITIDGDSPDTFLALDGAAKVLSGSPLFQGPIAFVFDDLQESVVAVAGVFDEIGSTAMTVYGADGEILGQITNTVTGHDVMGFASVNRSTPLIKAVLFHFAGEEPFGFALDSLRFGHDLTEGPDDGYLVPEQA